MLKTKFRRFAALLAVVALLTSALGLAIGGTGAYFTATQPGSITGNLGTVAVAISGQSINFADLLPGQVATQTVNVQNTGTANEDMYLVFDNANYAWSAVNDLGQYGKFVINGNTYDNLNNAYAQGSPGSGVMSTNPLSGCYNIPRNAIAYLPHQIFLGTWTPGQVASFNVAFNFNPCLTSGAGGTLWAAAGVGGEFTPAIGPVPLLFKVAAFQQGVSPSDQMNGAGMIAPLSLPIGIDTRPVPKGTFQ
jgi:hypothetical protein